jgi:hypothetical protein
MAKLAMCIAATCVDLAVAGQDYCETQTSRNLNVDDMYIIISTLYWKKKCISLEISV